MRPVLGLLLLTLAACAPAGTDESRQYRKVDITELPPVVSFRYLVEKVLEPRDCLGCHSPGGSAEEHGDFRVEDGLLSQVVPGDLANSKLYTRVLPPEGDMPLKRPPLTKAELEIVKRYVLDLKKSED